jgi:hypothetical protein
VGLVQRLRSRPVIAGDCMTVGRSCRPGLRPRRHDRPRGCSGSGAPWHRRLSNGQSPLRGCCTNLAVSARRCSGGPLHDEEVGEAVQDLVGPEPSHSHHDCQAPAPKLREPHDIGQGHHVVEGFCAPSLRRA